MIKISAIFLITFLGMSTCLDLSAKSGVILPSIESKGELINMMVQVKTEGNTNTIAGFLGQLREMLDKLVNAQAKHKRVHAKMMKQCLEEGAFRKRAIKVARVALKNATSALNRCRVSLKAALKELPGLQATLRSYKRELARAQAARDVERKKYLQRRQEFTEALEFLNDFISYVQKRVAATPGASLVEYSENLLKHSNKLNIMSEAAPVLASIAMETVSLKSTDNYKFTPNQRLQNRLRALLADLLKRITADNNANEAAEKAAVAVFNKYKNRLDKVINTLQRNVDRVQKQIRDMRACVAREGAVMASSSAKIARNAKLLKSAGAMCKSFNKEFIEATYNRLNEIKTMQEILVIVLKRFKDLPRDLVKYLEQVKGGFKAYVNSTEFHKFKEYERKRFAVNRRGKLLAHSNADKDHNVVAAVVKGRKGIYPASK